MRILFTTHAMPSHFTPLQPLASAALAAGHTVAFATGSTLAELVERAGFAFIRAGANLNDPEVEAVVKEVFALSELEQRPALYRRVFGGILSERLMPDLLRILDEFRPDIVVSEITELTAPVLAEQRGLPASVVLFGLLPRLDEPGSVLREGLRAVRARLGLDMEPSEASFERALKLIFASPSYQHPGLSVPGSTRFFRPQPSLIDRGQQLPAWLTRPRDRPLVYGTLGTVPTFNARPGALRTMIEALGACDVHGIVTCGQNQDPAALGPLPDNVRVERFIPQELLLEHCRALISHGGYGTTMGALSAGVPMVLTPIGADQPLHAQRCQELGVAVLLQPGEVNVASLKSALEKILREPRYAERARAMRDELDAMPGMDAALAALASFALGSAAGHGRAPYPSA